MPQKTSAEMLTTLFAEINNIVLPSDTSEGASSPSGFACLMLPGQTVQAEEYDITKKDGKKNTYVSMNRIPALNKHYIDSTKTVSGLFEAILSASPPEDNMEEAEKKKASYEKATALLGSEVAPSKKYTSYLERQYAYEDAIDEYLREINKAAKDENEIRVARRNIARTKQDWIARGFKAEIDDALNICTRYLAYTPTSVYAAATKLYDDTKELVKADIGEAILPVECTPVNWATHPEKLSWTNVVITYNSETSKMHHEISQIDSESSVNVRYGLWSVSGSGGYHNKVEKIAKGSVVDKLGFSFDIARVDIQRPWFKDGLLTYQGTSVLGCAKGRLCAGSLTKAAEYAKAGEYVYPFIPTAFIVARNINLYNDFNSEEETLFNEAKSWSADVKVGYGPFSIGNKTSSSKNLTDEEKKLFGSAMKITVGDGMQIIGFINSVLTPAFPTADYVPRVQAATAGFKKRSFLTVDAAVLAKLHSHIAFCSRYGNVDSAAGDES